MKERVRKQARLRPIVPEKETEINRPVTVLTLYDCQKQILVYELSGFRIAPILQVAPAHSGTVSRFQLLPCISSGAEKVYQSLFIMEVTQVGDLTLETEIFRVAFLAAALIAFFHGFLAPRGFLLGLMIESYQSGGFLSRDLRDGRFV
jgi:hypothetical protein